MLIHSCGGRQFNVLVKRPGVVEFDDNNIPAIIVEATESTTIDFVSCVQCGESIVDTDTQLVEATQCNSCASYVPDTSIDDNGQCEVCANPRPDLQGLTQTDYIRRILDLEKQMKELKSKNDIPELDTDEVI